VFGDCIDHRARLWLPTTLEAWSTSLYNKIGDCTDHRARLRLPTMLRDWSTSLYDKTGNCIDHRARLWLPTMLGDSPTSLCNVLENYADHRARLWLPSMLGDFSFQLHTNRTHIQLRDDFDFLDPATRLILRLPASSGTTSVRCIWRCISVTESL
jgi:hypothetical protein